jgi:hypothetical protein
MFRGTTYASHFNFGATEETYIRGGKDGSNVIINDGALGKVGIGTTSPQAKLHINSNNEVLRLSGTSQSIGFYEGATRKSYIWNDGGSLEINAENSNTSSEVRIRTSGLQALTAQSDGRVRIGNLGCTIAAQGSLPKLSIQGPLGFKKHDGDQIGEWTISYCFPAIGYANSLGFFYNGGFPPKAYISEFDGTYIQSSDLRLKENFEYYKLVLQEIKKLDVLTYHYKDDKTNTRSFGLIAQNVQQYFPEIVSGIEGKDSYLGISYAKTGVLAIKAIQEQQVIIEEMKREIDLLKEQNKKLVAAIDKLIQNKQP